ncbi:MAG: chemotaxis protein CheB [Acidobacteria bacterium]|nr:MAG: chemotaxis protein CheB [Acidobacteriota bacterium]
MKHGRKSIIIIGSSTGGIKALKEIFNGFPLVESSIIIVQHMPHFINRQIVHILSNNCSMEVQLAEHDQEIEPGTILIAPSERHLILLDNRKIALQDGPKVCFVKPSVDVCMLSAQQSSQVRFMGIILTGMGSDGTNGIQHMKKIGAKTIAQDKASSTIWSMPSSAIETGCVDLICTPEQISNNLINFCHGS